MTIILVLIVHVLLCGIITIIKRIIYRQGSGYMIAIMWLIPIVGILLYYADDYVQRHVSDMKRGYKRIKEQSFEVDELESDGDQDADIIVPVEEAIFEGNEKLRRRLMLKLIDSRESNNVRLLKKLAAAEDREVAHFASTTLMEYRRSHEQEIAEMVRKVDEDEQDRVALEEYCALLKEYVESGILPPTIKGTYLDELKRRYEQLIKLTPKDMDNRELYLRTLMETGTMDDSVGSLINETLEQFPMEMRSYQLAAEYSYLNNRKDGIDNALEMADERHVYFNQQGRKWQSFWKEEAE